MHDDFDFEPIPGLPGQLPKGEELLWQGSPHWFRLAREAFKLWWIMGYFALLILWRVGVSSADFPLAQALVHAVPFVVLAVLAFGVICLLAWVQARGTIYTLTTHRVMMRIGAALQMTLNLPYTWIENAELATKPDGSGTIALELKGDSRVSYLMSWPHVRPWHLARSQPALRCIPQANAVAMILADAAETRVSDASSIRVSAPDALPAE